MTTAHFSSDRDTEDDSVQVLYYNNFKFFLRKVRSRLKINTSRFFLGVFPGPGTGKGYVCATNKHRQRRLSPNHFLLFVLNFNLEVKLVKTYCAATSFGHIATITIFFLYIRLPLPPKKYCMFSDGQWTSLTFLDSVDYHPVGAVRHRRISSPVSTT